MMTDKIFKLAVDVLYNEEANVAKIVALLFTDWQAAEPVEILTEQLTPIAPYEPGNFYKRELPCILLILRKVDITQLDSIIIDGFVYLDDEGKEGLGAHLYHRLSGRVPIIGVAKTPFHHNKKNVVEVYRGQSNKPLYVTAIGMDKNKAAGLIQCMHGNFRAPTLLKMLDYETRKKL